MNSPSELATHLGYWLRYVSNHVSHAFARRLDAHGVTVAEWVVLRSLLGEEHLAPSQLAVRMGVSRGTISKLADRLIAKSLLTRTADPHDRRAQTLALTPTGQALVPALAALADQNDTEFFEHLSAQDRATLLRILRDIVAQQNLHAVPLN